MQYRISVRLRPAGLWALSLVLALVLALALAPVGAVAPFGGMAGRAYAYDREAPADVREGGEGVSVAGGLSLGKGALSRAADANGLSPQAGELDPAALGNGTYSVAVRLVKADDFSQASMAASAFDGVDGLTVRDGAYSLSLKLGSVQVGGIVGSVTQLGYYPSYTVGENSLTVSGASTVVFTAASEGDAGPANVPIGDVAKASGYVALRLWSDAMGATSQPAALKLDWATLVKLSDDVDDGAFANNADPNAANEEQESAAAQQQEGSQARSGAAKFGGVYEAGHVYSVPLAFMKQGTREASMAAQYFGGAATVRLVDGAMFDVRFSTNRPDYVLELSYDGAPAAVVRETSSLREYSIRVPATTEDAVLPVTMSIKPMIELGSGPVTADMHLAFSRAADLGADTGQGASSLPGTGDSLGALPAGAALAAVLCAFGLMGLVAVRRKIG